MRRSMAVCALGGLLAISASQARAQDGDAALPWLRAELEKAAKSIEAIDYFGFGYGRLGPTWWIKNEPLEAFLSVRPRITDGKLLVPLLRHEDAKVRTLAMLLLYDREEPQWLPDIAKLFGDDAATIRDRQSGSVALIDGKEVGERWRFSPRTVGVVAEGLVNFYYYGAPTPKARDATQRFDSYWQARRGRTHCASWIQLRMLRAHGGREPVFPELAPKLRRVRAAVDALPSPDRELMLLALVRDNLKGVEAFATEAERIAAAKKLGVDVLLRVFAGDFPSTDPDLPLLFGGESYRASAMQQFLLAPERGVFEAAHAEKLLAIGTRLREEGKHTTGYSDCRWAICAASLRPDRATEWLSAALQEFDRSYEAGQRAMLLSALIQFGDEASEQLVVATFWQPALTASFGVESRKSVLATIVARGDAKGERIMDALLAAEAFATADPGSVLEVGRAVAKLVGNAPIDEQKVHRIRHPQGIPNLCDPKLLAAAKKNFPAETEALLQAAELWRKAIRKAWRER